MITFLVPVLNDIRVKECIKSIHDFDDLDSCNILLMAGRSDKKFCNEVSSVLKERDRLFSEPDNGLFDALNRGLDLVDNSIVGWIGADDIISLKVKASEVLSSFSGDIDAVIYSSAYVRNGRITRVLDSRYSSDFFFSWGFHNPHFSTFLKKECADKARFEINEVSRNQFADIVYFTKVLSGVNRVITRKIAVYMSEGGVGSGNIKAVIFNLKSRYEFFKVNNSSFRSLIMVINNYVWKIMSKIYHMFVVKSIAE